MKTISLKVLLSFSIIIAALVSVSTIIEIQDVSLVKTTSPLNENINSETGPDQRPSQWAWERRTFPYYKADAEYYRTEIEKAREMKSQAVSRGVQQIEFAGPTNIGGRISDIEFNPNDPNIVYAGAATGGVFKSTDMGNTWTAIFDDAANLNVGDIGIDPNNPDIIYVGTGEANGGHNNFPGGGVYKSVDAGQTWQLIGLENSVSVGRIVVDPSNSNRIFVAAVGSYFTPNPERGIFRSDDGGATWENVLFVSDSTGAIDIIIDPVNPSRLIASMWERVRRPFTSHLYGPTSGLYKSLDGGDTWTKIEPSAGLPDSQAENIGRIGIALCKSQPDIVYAMYTNGGSYIGFYKSANFGTTWSNADPDLEIANGTAGFSWYFGQVRVHPDNPDMVYALDVAFMRSTNSGDTWPIMYGYGGGPWNFHVDQHALAFNPNNPDYIICGNDGGMNISTDGGVDFTKVSSLPITQFYEIGLDHNNPDRLYGGTQDNGTLRTLTGNLDDWHSIYGGDGFYVIVNYQIPDIIYAESQNGNLGKSTDGGESFWWSTNGISEAEPKNWSTPVIMDPMNSSTLYYGTNRIYRTTNNADFWTAISSDLTDGTTGSRRGTITTIGVSPVNTNIIYAGTSDGHVWVSTNNGSTWNDISATLPYRTVTRVIADPFEENTAYVTFSGLKWADPEPHVFRTTDAGQTWTDISSNLPDAPINGFAVDPVDNHYLFVGTDLGAYFSFNKGASWEYLDEELPVVSIYDLKIHDTEHYLALGTHARSMYKLDLTTLVGVGNKTADIKSDVQLNCFPNPFRDETNITFELSQKENVLLKVYDLQGRKVASLLNKTMPAGKHAVKWNGSNDEGINVASGSYILKIKTGNKSETRKVILER
jgi:photosystem II stability/assembly factor-like uncharacterized protein